MPNYLSYQKSVAEEFKAYENRVRNLIDDSHWGEEGRYKEIILMNFLKRVLPKNLSVGTGFVRNKDTITNQIDIIIYDNTFPLLFSEGDFVVTTPNNVIGVVEVKTKIEPVELCDTIGKANENALIISEGSDNFMFNGIFSFNSGNNPDRYLNHMEAFDYSSLLSRNHFNEIVSAKLYSCVNHIALGSSYFIKLWPVGQDDEQIEDPYYSLYEMQDGLAFSYFLSNLLEFVIRKKLGYFIEELPEELKSFFYPIPEGKERNLIKRVYFKRTET